MWKDHGANFRLLFNKNFSVYMASLLSGSPPTFFYKFKIIWVSNWLLCVLFLCNSSKKGKWVHTEIIAKKFAEISKGSGQSNTMLRVIVCHVK